MIFLRNKILNVNVILIGASEIKIVSWFPYDDENCGKYVRNLEIIAECSLETSRYLVTHHEVEKKKLINNRHHKCPLIAISLERAPYAFFSSKKNEYTGFEVELLEAFADKMHFDLILITVPYNSTEKSKELLVHRLVI